MSEKHKTLGAFLREGIEERKDLAPGEGVALNALAAVLRRTAAERISAETSLTAAEIRSMITALMDQVKTTAGLSAETGNLVQGLLLGAGTRMLRGGDMDAAIAPEPAPEEQPEIQNIKVEENPVKDLAGNKYSHSITFAVPGFDPDIHRVYIYEGRKNRFGGEIGQNPTGEFIWHLNPGNYTIRVQRSTSNEITDEKKVRVPGKIDKAMGWAGKMLEKLNPFSIPEVVVTPTENEGVYRVNIPGFDPKKHRLKCKEPWAGLWSTYAVTVGEPPDRTYGLSPDLGSKEEDEEGTYKLCVINKKSKRRGKITEVEVVKQGRADDLFEKAPASPSQVPEVTINHHDSNLIIGGEERWAVISGKVPGFNPVTDDLYFNRREGKSGWHVAEKSGGAKKITPEGVFSIAFTKPGTFLFYVKRKLPDGKEYSGAMNEVKVTAAPPESPPPPAPKPAPSAKPEAAAAPLPSQKSGESPAEAAPGVSPEPREKIRLRLNSPPVVTGDPGATVAIAFKIEGVREAAVSWGDDGQWIGVDQYIREDGILSVAVVVPGKVTVRIKGNDGQWIQAEGRAEPPLSSSPRHNSPAPDTAFRSSGEREVVLRPKKGGAAGMEMKYGQNDKTMTLDALDGIEVKPV